MNPQRHKTFKLIYIPASVVIYIILALLYISSAGIKLEQYNLSERYERANSDGHQFGEFISGVFRVLQGDMSVINEKSEIDTISQELVNNKSGIHALSVAIWVFTITSLLLNIGSLFYLVPNIINDYKYFASHNISILHACKCLSRQKILVISFIVIIVLTIFYVLAFIIITFGFGFSCGLGSPFNDLVTAVSFLCMPIFGYSLLSAIYFEREAILSI